MKNPGLYCLLALALTMPCIPAQTDYNNLYRSQREFSIDLFKAILTETDTKENMLWSPDNVYQALLLIYFGSSNRAEQELARALHLQWAKNKSEVILAYRLAKQKRSAEMMQEYVSGVKVYFDKKTELSDHIGSIFLDELESLDLSDKVQSARFMNYWIGNVTLGEIDGFITPFDIGELATIGASFFKGHWADKFDPKDTTQEVFYSTPSTQFFVPMMRKRGTFSRATDELLGAHVLQMPFAKSKSSSSEISMVIFLPPFTPNGLDDIFSKLTLKSFDSALDNKSEDTEINVSIPKFKFKLGLNFEIVLRKIGINSVFDESVPIGSFFGNSSIQLDSMIQHSMITINEGGSDDILKFRSTFDSMKHFECNHPFLYFIYDQTAKSILLAGIYRAPKNEEK